MNSEPCPRIAAEDAAAEAIAARDANNLYRASCFFQDPARYRSFCAQYAVMRVVDDRVDALPTRTGLDHAALELERAVINAWEVAVDSAYTGVPEEGDLALGHPEGPHLVRALGRAFVRFPVPQALWSHFFAAMRSDLKRARFGTFDEFLGYAEGATVAPTTIFLYLLSSGERECGRYLPPPQFDLERAGRALGLFAYLGHILRDMADDLATGEEGLLYLAADDLLAHGVTELQLRRALSRKESCSAIRSLTATLMERARCYLREGRQLLAPLEGRLEPDCAFVLEVTITLYEETLNRLEQWEGDPFRQRHFLEQHEKASVVRAVAQRTGFEPHL